LRVLTEHVPRIEPARRVETTELTDGFHAMTLRYGFMEGPNIPRALMLESAGCPLMFNMMQTSFFVGKLTIIPSGHSAWWRLKLNIFQFMHRNALSATEFFQIPPGRVVEFGGQVEI
ncbi:MAG TPA: potassium transporter Kup, partial [Methylocystis sp.]